MFHEFFFPYKGVSRLSQATKCLLKEIISFFERQYLMRIDNLKISTTTGFLSVPYTFSITKFLNCRSLEFSRIISSKPNMKAPAPIAGSMYFLFKISFLLIPLNISFNVLCTNTGSVKYIPASLLFILSFTSSAPYSRLINDSNNSPISSIQYKCVSINPQTNT